MKIFKNGFALFTSTVLVAVIMLTGCGKEDPVLDSSLLLQNSVYNFLSTKSLRYDVNFDVSDPKVGDAEAVLSGAYSYSDSENEGMELNLVASVTDADAGDYKLDASSKIVDKDFYLKLLSLPVIPNFPVEVFSKFVGPWWKIDAGELGGENQSFDADSIGGLGRSVDELDDQGKQIRQLILVSKFFKDIEFDGIESTNGYESYRYKVKLDAEGVADFLKGVSEIIGETTDGQFDFGGMSLADILSFDGDVWVDSLSETLIKVDGIISLVDSSDTKNVSKIDFTVSFSDLNMPFSIEAPIDYQVFDFVAFLGAFFQSGIMGGIGEAVPEEITADEVPAEEITADEVPGI